MNLSRIIKKEKYYLFILVILTILCAVVYPYRQLAMWLAFMLAAYSAIANDSIQTIGTFISSNSRRPWYLLWLFMGLIFVFTVTYSFILNDGDISYQRLQTPGLDKAPQEFVFLQVFAPVVLLILTRFKMPVSTSILLLSSFSTKVSSIGSILGKSFFGYILAFLAAMIVWSIVTKYFEKYRHSRIPGYWYPLQWITSGTLWSVWVMQDAANIAVVLPRQLDTGQFLFFVFFIFIGLGFLFYLKGDKIQSIVNEKSDVTDVRAATIIDFVYAILLYYLKVVSTIPISTTWVFIGLLGGRELAINLQKDKKLRQPGVKYSVWMIGKDMRNAAIGLLISLILAVAINDAMRESLLNIF